MKKKKPVAPARPTGPAPGKQVTEEQRIAKLK